MKKIDFQHILWITGNLSTLAYLGLLFLGDVRPRIEAFFVLYGAVFLLYALALWPLLRHRGMDTPAQARSGQWPRELWLIFGFAVLFRLLLLGAAPHLSDDIWRYLWDGRVWSAGINPYRYAPNAEALRMLRDNVIYPNVNHPAIPTIYPPVLQGLFRLLYAIKPAVLTYKIAFVLFDLATLAVLIALLRHRKQDVRWSLVYAWNPLVIVETAGSGHLDAVGVFFLVLFFLLMEMERFKTAALSFAAAVLTKFAPLLLLPFLALRMRKSRALWLPGGIIALILLAYLPFLDAGAGLFKAVTVYSTKWSFNASVFWAIFTPLRALLPQNLVRDAILAKDMTPDAQTLASTRVDLALLYTKAGLGMAFAAFYAWLLHCAWRTRRIRQPDLLQLWLLLFGLLCLISPTLHPWYLIWLLPVLGVWTRSQDTSESGMRSKDRKGKDEDTASSSTPRVLWTRSQNASESGMRSKDRKAEDGDAAIPPTPRVLFPLRAGLLLTGLIMLSYLILPGYFYHGIWQEYLSTRLLIFIPFYAMLVYDGYRMRRVSHAEE